MKPPLGQRVLVVGYGRSGRAAARLFSERGARVTVSDARPPGSFQTDIPALISQKIGFEFGAHRAETFLTQDLVVVSPGVPWDTPALEQARADGIRVVPEVEAASWFVEGCLIGITGSNGKTTTTELVGRMLQGSEFPTFVGGNIGVPLISAADAVSRASMVVTELSSFQLEGIQDFHPRVAALLNLSPNHLDRHASYEAYVEAKARIFRNQTTEDYAVLNADDPRVMALADEIRSQKILFSVRRDLASGVALSQGQILYRVGRLERVLFHASDVRLRGSFNLENALAAAAIACVAGADFDAIGHAVREFRGVEHRLEYAGELGGVQFYNDSKATSVDATVKALSAFDRGVYLILGGKDKGAPYAPIREMLSGRVQEVLLIGTAADRIERELEGGAAKLVRSGELETAIRQAFEAAKPGDVILLSPACSSYDQFRDFEERGRVFKEVVAQIAEEGRPPGRAQTRFWQFGKGTQEGRRVAEAGGERAPATDRGAAPTASPRAGAAERAHFHELEGVQRPEGQVRFRLEPVCLYEIEGELSAPMGIEIEALEAGESEGDTPQAALAECDEAGSFLSSEPRPDEPLMFEVRRTVRASAARRTLAREGAQDAQPRLPGLEDA